MTSALSESTVEEAALSWFTELSYAVQHGPDIAPGEAAAERDSFGYVVLNHRLWDAIDRLNPKIPHEARDEALRKVLRPDSPSLVGNNRKFHAMLREAVEVEYRRRVELSPPSVTPCCRRCCRARCGCRRRNGSSRRPSDDTREIPDRGVWAASRHRRGRQFLGNHQRRGQM